MRAARPISTAWVAIALAAAVTAMPLVARGATAHAPRGARYAENLKRWQGLSEDQRRAIREAAKRITPEQMAQLKEKLGQFRQLPEEEQERIRGNQQRFQGMRPGMRRTLEGRFRRFQALPEERRGELRRRFGPGRRGPGHGVGPGKPGPGPAFAPGKRPGGAERPFGPGKGRPVGPGKAKGRPGPFPGGRRSGTKASSAAESAKGAGQDTEHSVGPQGRPQPKPGNGAWMPKRPGTGRDGRPGGRGLSRPGLGNRPNGGGVGPRAIRPGARSDAGASRGGPRGGGKGPRK